MLWTPDRPTPAPAPPCPLRQAYCLQPHRFISTSRKVTTRSTSHTSSTHACLARLPMCNTITTNDSLRTPQVQRCQRHQLAQRRRQCRHALCAKAAACNHTTHAQSVTPRITLPRLHTSTAQHHQHHHTHTRLPRATITTYGSLRTAQVQRCQRHQLAQRRRQCRHVLCAKLVFCITTPTHAYTPHYTATLTHLHCTTPPPTHTPSM